MGLLEPVDLDAIPLHAILHALGDRTRLAMVRVAAAGGEFPCRAFELGRPESTMSRHFQVLREAGLIRREELDARFPGLLAAILRDEAG